MSAVATAIVGGAIIGGVVANNASKRATKAAKSSEAAALAFEQERYDDWKDTYGDLETNLSEYYGNLTPDYYTAMGLEDFQNEFELNMTQLNESLAQRGILDSGISASLELQGQLSSAESKATIRRESERQALADKTSFLQIGLGQNPADGLSNVMQDQASAARSRANSADVAAGQAVGNAIQVTGTAIADYNRGNS